MADSRRDAGSSSAAGTGTVTRTPCFAPIRSAAAMISATAAGVATFTSTGRPLLRE
jgi:hypothetical protein